MISDTNKKPTVLLIGEDKETAKMYGLEFSINDMRVVYAFDGKQGIKSIHKYIPDVIILDILLPKINGLEILKKIRENRKSKNIPVIIWSNCDDLSTIGKAVVYGRVDYVKKVDTTPSDLLELVKSRVKNYKFDL